MRYHPYDLAALFLLVKNLRVLCWSACSRAGSSTLLLLLASRYLLKASTVSCGLARGVAAAVLSPNNAR